MSIQGSINSMIGSVGSLVSLGKDIKKGFSVQAQAADAAKQSSQNAVEAKATQRRNFKRDYFGNQDVTIGNWTGKASDLPKSIQDQMLKQTSPAERKKIMDTADAKRKARLKELNDEALAKRGKYNG